MRKAKKILLTAMLVGSMGILASCGRTGSSTGNTSTTPSTPSTSVSGTDTVPVTRIVIDQEAMPDYVVNNEFLDVTKYVTFYGAGNVVVENPEFTLTPTSNADCVEIDGSTIIPVKESNGLIRIQIKAGNATAYLTFTSISQTKNTFMKALATLGDEYAYYNVNQDGSIGEPFAYNSSRYIMLNFNNGFEGYGQFGTTEAPKGMYYIKGQTDIHGNLTSFEADPGAIGIQLSDYTFGGGLSIDPLSFTSHEETDAFGNLNGYLETTDDETVENICLNEMMIYSPKESFYTVSDDGYSLSNDYNLVSQWIQIIPNAFESTDSSVDMQGHLISIGFDLEAKVPSEQIQSGSYYISQFCLFTGNDAEELNTLPALDEFLSDESNIPTPISPTALKTRLSEISEINNYTIDIKHQWAVIDRTTGEVKRSVPVTQIPETWTQSGIETYISTKYGTRTVKVNGDEIYNEMSIDTVGIGENSEPVVNTATSVSGFKKVDDQLYSFTGSSLDTATWTTSTDEANFSTKARVGAILNANIDQTNISTVTENEDGSTVYKGTGIYNTDFLRAFINLDPYSGYAYGDGNIIAELYVNGMSWLNQTSYTITVEADGDIHFFLYVAWDYVENSSSEMYAWTLDYTITNVGTTTLPELTVPSAN